MNKKWSSILTVAIVALATVSLLGFAKSIYDSLARGIDDESPYRQAGTRAIGHNCQYAALPPSSTFDTPLNVLEERASLLWQATRLPYGPEPYAKPAINSIMLFRCTIDLSALNPNEYIELSLGPVFENAKVFLNGTQKFQTMDNGYVTISLSPAEIGDPSAKLSFVSVMNANTRWPGFSSYIPMAIVRGSRVSANIRFEYFERNNGVLSVRVACLGLLLVLLMCIFAIGVQYPDLVAAILLGSLMFNTSWINLHGVPFDLLNSTETLRTLRAILPSVFLFFAMTFIARHQTLYSAFRLCLATGFVQLVLLEVPGFISWTYISGTRLTRLSAAAIFLFTAVYALQQSRVTKGIRRIELYIFAVLSGATAIVSLVTILSEKLYGTKIFYHTDYYLVLTILAFYIVDLAVFQQRFVSEAQQNYLLKSQLSQNRAIVDAVLLLMHDLKRPFFILKAMLSRMRFVQNSADVDALLREHLPALDQSNEHAAQLIRGIAQIQSAQTLNPTVFLLAALIKDEILTLPVFASVPKSISVSVDLRHGFELRGDREKIARVIMNLFENAAQAAPSGSQISFRSLVSAESKLLIEIFNEGSFVPEEKRELIFDLFYSTKGRFGSGIGLSVARSIVVAHGGTIKADSKQGVGTTFRMIFPADILTRTVESACVVERKMQVQCFPDAPDTTAGIDHENLTSNSIVIVDDDPFVLAAWKRKFEEYSCVLFQNSGAAIVFLRGLNPQQRKNIRLIICDYYFQDERHIDGFAVAAEINSFTSIPVIVTSQIDVGVTGVIPEGINFVTKDEILEMSPTQVFARCS